MTIRKIDPKPTAPKPAPKPSVPPPPPPRAAAPAGSGELSAKVAAKTGQTSGFEAYKPPAVVLDRRDQPAAGEATTGRDPTADTQGRGTNDDSIGRGTNDDSIGRGTNDDSIGRGTNDDSIGRGTNDDSIGGTGATGRGTSDAGVGLTDEPTARGTALVPGREGLSVETSAKMDRLLAADDSERARQARYVFESPQFKELPADQQTKIVDVMDRGGIRCARGMAEMFEQSGGAMLQAKGSDGTTVLDSLDRLSQSENKELAGTLMYDLVNPGRIWQGRAPTCTVSTMQYELAHSDPGEYARLITGLATDGKVTMRGGGVLETDPNWALYASDARHDDRSKTEALFQAAAMEYANGTDSYLEYSQMSVGGPETYRGLRGAQISNMVGQLFGVKYETKEIGSDAEATAELNEIMARERPNRPVLFDIMVDGQQSNHCVSLEAVRNGRVYYRDPTTGDRQSMTVDEFRQSLAAVHYAPETSFLGGLVGKFKNLFKIE